MIPMYRIEDGLSVTESCRRREETDQGPRAALKEQETSEIVQSD